MKEKNKFKGDSAKWLTQALFLEECQALEKHAMYTLQPWDKRKGGIFYPSIHKLYVEMEDVGEWNFANTYFDGFQHWLLVKSRPFFKEYYAAMVEELNAKLRGKSLDKMLALVESGEAPQSVLKYLADNDYIPKDKKGRPTKASIKKEAKHLASVSNILQSDLDRISK
jgi:hypothetical protein